MGPKGRKKAHQEVLSNSIAGLIQMGPITAINFQLASRGTLPPSQADPYLRARELLKSESWDLGDDIVNGWLKGSGCLERDVIWNHVQRVAAC
jgi:hypothetical protein